MIGFDTIGNATLIAYDDVPIISTDPWTNGEAYFGSWGMSHQIPEEQRESIRRAKYHWFSHAHPDHLNVGSLAELDRSTLLLADHQGSRVRDELTSMGYKVSILPDREWIRLSPSIRVMTVPDYNQDSILLLDIAGTLVLNLNDASDHGWGRFVRRIAKSFNKEIYLLNLVTWGDADMINLYTEDGARIPPKGESKPLIAPRLQNLAVQFGANHIIPFSCFHRYEREDSIWANQFMPSLDDYYKGVDSKKPRLLQPFLRVDCDSGKVTPLEPHTLPLNPRSPSQFNDNWNDRLEQEDEQLVSEYFLKKEHLRKHFGFVRFRVGGHDFTVDLNRRLPHTGLTFEVPRNSLTTAIKYEIFDDLLIGNFMKTTLHGGATLYPHFSPVVAKYADNGRAQSCKELHDYMWQYYKRDVVGQILLKVEENSMKFVRMLLPEESVAFKSAKSCYWHWKQR
jgi:hypothetical protein